MLTPREWRQIPSSLLNRERLADFVLTRTIKEAPAMHIETPNLRRTYVSRIEDFFKRDYGPHTQESVREATDFPNDIVRTSLHALKRHGVVVLLRSVAGTNLWLYNPRGDKRRFLNPYRVKEEGRKRNRDRIHYVRETDTI